MLKFKILILLLFLSLGISLFSQTDSLKDTIKAEDVNTTIELIKKADSLKTVDSLKRLFIVQQISQLKENQKKEKKDLEQKLKELATEDSIRLDKLKKEIDSLQKQSVGYPIIPYKDTLFIIYTPIGTINQQERAIILNQRLLEIYKIFIPEVDSILIVDLGQTVELIFEDKTIMSITDLDEMWYKRPKLEIAQDFQKVIVEDIIYYKSNKSLWTLLIEIGLSVIVIIGQYFLIRFVNYLFKKRIDNFLLLKKGIWFKEIKIKDYQFLDSERLTNVVLTISKFIRWFINILQLYITIPILFSIFPPTRRLAEKLFTYTYTPIKEIGKAIINFIPNLFMIFVVIVITRYLLKFIKFLTKEIADEKLKIPGFYSEWATPTFNIVRFFVLAFMIVMIFPYLPGSDSDVFKGVSVFIGVIFSLGSTSIIGNIIAGIVLTYMRPFKIGDRIKVGDLVGDVVEKTPFVTRIKSTKNEYITIPNSNILSSNVINYSTSQEKEGIILNTTVTIGYDAPWRKVHQLLIKAALKTDKISNNPLPFVLQTSLDDFYVSYQLNAYSLSPNYMDKIYSELHQNIQDTFAEANVEIMSPHYEAQRDGASTTIPKINPKINENKDE